MREFSVTVAPPRSVHTRRGELDSASKDMVIVIHQPCDAVRVYSLSQLDSPRDRHYVKAFEARRLAERSLRHGDCRTRRTWIKLWIPALIAYRAAAGKEARPMFQQILEVSLNEKKSVTVFIGGQSLGGGVVKLSGDTVELRSLEHPRIVIRLDSIDAVALV